MSLLLRRRHRHCFLVEHRHPLAILLGPDRRAPGRFRYRLSLEGALTRPLVAVYRGIGVDPLDLAVAEIPGREELAFRGFLMRRVESPDFDGKRYHRAAR